jgi:hypothetical protein
MVIERFKDRNPAPIYARVRERGRALQTVRELFPSHNNPV